MTLAELAAIIESKTKQRMNEMKFVDTLNGILCSLLANINRSSDTDPFKPSDFMIVKEDQKTEEHPELIENKLKLMAAAGLIKHG